MKAPAKSPCGSCPYRRDVPSGVWHEEEYAKLPLYDASTGEQPPQMFACHQQDGRLCAGWCGTHDMENNLALRVGMISGRLSEQDYEAAIDYVSPVPLFGSGAQAAEHGRASIADPDVKAQRTIVSLERKRALRIAKNP